MTARVSSASIAKPGATPGRIPSAAKACLLGMFALGVSVPATPVLAADASGLGRGLTYAGAQAAGNADGSIPAFEGVEPSLPGWSVGKFRGDYWKHRGERPLFSITSANVAQSAAHLTPGQQAMFAERPGYQMDIYPTHRDCGLPDFVQQNTIANAGKATIGSDGWSLTSAALPSVPFPVPKNGIEALTNFQTRYQGVAIDWDEAQTVISPRPGGSDFIYLVYNQLFYYPWGKKGVQSPQDVGDLQNGTFYAFLNPNALAGQALVQRYYFGRPAESYYYFTGQRRVRRLPTYAYDSPIIGTENTYPNDAIEIFYGNPDRFNWKLLGKKEIYVPYNSFQDFRLPVSKVGVSYPDTAVRRYELHRVWVVEATVKEGVRHNTPRKVLYLDEDSWIAVAGDEYDADKRLWHYKEMLSWPDYEASACTTAGMFMTYDLLNGRYFADQVLFGLKKDVQLLVAPSQDGRLRDDFYSPENLRTISER